jgi:hypothetical protein
MPLTLPCFAKSLYREATQGMGGEVTLYMRLAALTLLSMLPIAATAQDNSPPRASGEDCAVIGAIAGWQGGAPSVPMNAKSFAAGCDWKALGLPQPAITTEEHPVLSFGYSQPVYDADGMHATVDYSYGGDQSATGHPERYFYTGSKCAAEKRDGKWQSLGCKMGFIT